MSSIYTEVRELIAGKIAAGQVVIVDWVTREVIGAHADIEGSDADFYLGCASAHVKEIVKRVVGKYDAAKGRIEEQLVLEGYEYLQVAYSVEREGGTVLVPVDQLTDAEIEDRAKEYDAMAVGCRVHADELRLFSRSRGIAA